MFADEVSIPLDGETESGGDAEGEEASEDAGEAVEEAETKDTSDEPESAVQAEEAVEEEAVADEAAPAPGNGRGRSGRMKRYPEGAPRPEGPPLRRKGQDFDGKAY